MKKWFDLPDGQRVLISDVLGGKLPEALEFAPMPYYETVAQENAYTGVYGVTRLLNGVRYAYLQYCVDYAVDIDKSAFMVLGIGAHNLMENDENGFENSVFYENIRGRSDLLQDGILTDYKTAGAFSVKKKLGFYECGQAAVMGPDGKPELYKRSGKWGMAGDVKMKPVYAMDLDNDELFDYKYQLNMYRIMHQAMGDEVNQMRLFFIVRDGGMKAARENGIDKNIYHVEVAQIDDDVIKKYFYDKRDRLDCYMRESADLREQTSVAEEFVPEAVIREVMPPRCNKRETWGGRRCNGYCPVADACRLAGDWPGQNTWRNF